jgi:hypothetical protein
MKRCLGEGVIQSFLDGGLSGPAGHSAEAHFQECASCLRTAFDVLREGRLLSRLFTPILSTPVPTRRPWARAYGSLFYDRRNREYGR